MDNSNLPPGVTTSMIPGNTPEDEKFEQLSNMFWEFAENKDLDVLKDFMDQLGALWDVYMAGRMAEREHFAELDDILDEANNRRNYE